MKSDTPSTSARVTATLRALHQKLPRDQRIMDDPWAEAFVAGGIGRGILCSRLLTKWAISIEPTASALIATRDRFADEWARKTLIGPSQLVLLGAGYDTTAYRLAPEYPATTFFEIDHPATLEAKRTLLTRKNFLLPPERCKLVASNFEADELQTGLGSAGFDTTLPTFVNWMGVTYYLSLPAIHATLAAVSDLLAAPSVLTFDFFHPGVNHQETRWGRLLSRFSEPLTTFFTDDDVAAIAAQHGFEPAEIVRADEYARRQCPRADTERIFGGLAALRRLPR